jgi:hypothetical protein
MPRAGVALPPAKTPWLLLKMGDEFQLDPITRSGVFSWQVFDDPGQMYHRIDAILAVLIKLYPARTTYLYLDNAGVAWRQQLSSVSGDNVDDGFNKQITKWVEWQIWRDIP